MPVPELKQKKIARDTANAKAAKEAAAKAAKDAAELNKEIYASAQKYEAEYETVSYCQHMYSYLILLYFT